MAKRINATIIDPVGLYATPATKLVDTMKLFKSDIKLIYSSKKMCIRDRINADRQSKNSK